MSAYDVLDHVFFFPRKMNNTLDKLNFIEKINTFIKDMLAFKKDESAFWKPEYGVIIEELRDIATTAKGNIINAKEEFSVLPISKFNSFKEYVNNTDPTYLKETSGSNARFKSSRAKRKKFSACPHCGESMILIDNQFKCEKCTFTIEVKSNSTGSISGENSKHTNKILHTIAGIGKPPGSVQRILKHAVVWLTELQYLKEWLIAHKDRYETFSKAYKKETGCLITAKFFDRQIERKAENVWKVNEYHMLMDEFQQMLEEAKSIAQITSNMWYMKPEEILAIVRAYVEKHGLAIPDSDVKTEDGYEIGAYFSQLSLIPNFNEKHVKYQIEKLYGKKIVMAGLSFNYNEEFKRSETVIRRYDLLQGNSWIQRYAFNIPSSSISEAEISNILGIIMQFNDFYKQQKFKEKTRSCNSPLYAVVLEMILSLPAFRKFKDELIMFVPKKEQKTRTQISNTWIKFEQERGDILTKYMKDESQNDVVSKPTSSSFDTDVLSEPISKYISEPPVNIVKSNDDDNDSLFSVDSHYWRDHEPEDATDRIFWGWAD